MRTFFYNIGYFFGEARKTVRLNLLSNLFSVFGTGLILFLLGMVAAGWLIGNQIVTTLKEEAEISAYFDDGMEKEEKLKLVDKIRNIYGVSNATYVDETEAKSRMEDMLGEEASILELFEDNPFEAFIEIRIDLSSMDTILQGVEKMDGIDYVRDNKSVLTKMQQITRGIQLIGYLIVLAVGITTMIIISHMIRQGIYNNREQIHTLRLLGASDVFIGFPYILVGFFLTICGGMIAFILLWLIIHNGYQGLSTTIPFIPMPAKEQLLGSMSVLITAVSLILGLFGSLFGLSSIRRGEQ